MTEPKTQWTADDVRAPGLEPVMTAHPISQGQAQGAPSSEMPGHKERPLRLLRPEGPFKPEA